MRQQALKAAACGVTTALCVVLMLLGTILGLGMYLSPILAGFCLIPIGKKWGAKHQLLVWIAVSLLCLMLVPDAEQNLMFIGLFGWYPALRPKLQRLPPALRILAKVLLFNIIVIALEALITLVLVPEHLGPVFAAALLALGNLVFILYDAAIPRFENMADKITRF